MKQRCSNTFYIHTKFQSSIETTSEDGFEAGEEEEEEEEEELEEEELEEEETEEEAEEEEEASTVWALI